MSEQIPTPRKKETSHEETGAIAVFTAILLSGLLIVLVWILNMGILTNSQTEHESNARYAAEAALRQFYPARICSSGEVDNFSRTCCLPSDTAARCAQARACDISTNIMGTPCNASGSGLPPPAAAAFTSSRISAALSRGTNVGGSNTLVGNNGTSQQSFNAEQLKYSLNPNPGGDMSNLGQVLFGHCQRNTPTPLAGCSAGPKFCCRVINPCATNGAGINCSSGNGFAVEAKYDNTATPTEDSETVNDPNFLIGFVNAARVQLTTKDSTGGSTKNRAMKMFAGGLSQQTHLTKGIATAYFDPSFRNPTLLGRNLFPYQAIDADWRGSFTLPTRPPIITHKWCRDADGDGWGAGVQTEGTSPPSTGGPYVMDVCNDCDDGNASRNASCTTTTTTIIID